MCPYEVEQGQLEPCPVVLGTPVLSEPKNLHHAMVSLDWQDIEDASWYVVQYYHIDGGGGEWLDLPALGVDIAFHGSSAVVSNMDYGIHWLRVGAASCAGESEWSQIEELIGTRASDWEGVPVPEVAEGDEIEPCDEDADTSDNSPATGAPTISGTARVGEVLEVDTSGIADADGLSNVQYEYQWLADDSDISGATNATYTLVAGDEGKAIRVEVSFTDDAGNDESLTTEPTAVVAAAPPPPDNVRAVAQKSGAVELTWDAPHDATVTGYRIERRPASGDHGDQQRSAGSPRDHHTLVEDTGSADTGYTDNTAQKGVGYEYRVSARNEAGAGEESDWVNAEEATAPNSPATGTPTISGTSQVGKILTADTSGIADADGLSNVQYEHQWLADGADISGATNATYTLVAADEGKAIKVEVTFIDDAGNEETLTSAATDAVAAEPTPNSPATGVPAISGIAQVGETLTADTSGIADEDGLTNATNSYRWLADDTEIAGATSLTYTLVDADEGKAIKVEVSFTDDEGNNETLTSGATDAVAAVPPDAPGSLEVSLKDSGKLDAVWEAPASDGGSEVTGYRVQWKESAAGWDNPEDVSLAAAWDTAHTITGLTDGVEYAVRIIAVNDVGDSDPSEEAKGIPREATAPGLAAAAVDGALLTLTYDETLDVDSVPGAGAFTVSVGGDARGVDAVSVTDSTVTLTLALAVTARDGVLVSYIAPVEESAARTRDVAGNAAASFSDQPVTNDTPEEEPEPPDNAPATGAPVITGTAQVGETLTADTSGVADADGLGNVRYDYQWLADDAEIAGVTSSTYTLAAADEGKAIRVQVSFADDAGNEETLTSEATNAVAAAPTPNSPATGAPTINGTAQVGAALTADTSGIADADGLSNVQYEYQWLADDAEISGATSSTYTVAAANEGKAIKMEVTFTDDEGNDESMTSAATDAVAAAEPAEPPAKPRGLSATASHDSVTLTWDDPQDDSITGYVILRRVRENDVGGEFSELVADTSTAATTYTDNTAAASTTYTYRIKAINGAGTSERSRWFHIDIPAAPVPDKPTGLSATATHDQVVLTWDDPGDDSITGYVILRRHRYDDPKGHFDELVADTGTAATTYTDDTVAAGTSYTYRIKAINGAGPGERSRWSHIDTPAAP